MADRLPLPGQLGLVALLAFALAALLLQSRDAPAPDDLRATVIAPSGEPARECLATLWRRQRARRSMGAESSVRCDGEGRVAWGEVEPGSYALYVTGPGAAETRWELEIERSGIELELALPPGGALGGKVSLEGEPVSGAEVRLEGGRSARTDPEGRFTFQGVAVGRIAVKSVHAAAAGTAEAEVRAGEWSEVALELTPLPPRGVLGLSGEPVAEGFRVDEVVPEGPAAGILAAGDRIIATDEGSLAGRPPDEVLEALGGGLPGEEQELVVRRGEDERRVTVTRVPVEELTR